MQMLKNFSIPAQTDGAGAATRCSIVLAYHKPSLLLANSCLQPLHVGRALTDIDLGIPGDDTGDNISRKNVHYAELTGTYWAWKNLEATDYVGLFHYRRLLDFSGQIDTPAFDLPITSGEEILKRLALDEKSIAAHCAGQDIVTRRIQDLHEWSNHSLYSHYAAEHCADHLQMTYEVMRHHDSADAESFRRMLQGSVGYFTNMVIMRRDVFDEYCQWMFDTLGEVENHINLYERRFQKYNHNARIFGFLGERLTSHFILRSREQGLAVKEYAAASLVPGTNDRSHNFNTYDRSTYNTGRSGLKFPPRKQETMSGPAVSVLMAVYNLADTVASAVRSVLNQSLRNIELIVVNDGSKDGTRAILEELARTDDRITVVNQENQGLGLARNAGIERARAEYIHFMDGDDHMDEEFLEHLLGKAQHFDADIVISSHRSFDAATGRVIAEHSLPHTVLLRDCTNIAETPDLLLIPGHVWDKLYRRDFVSQFLFTPEGGEDLYTFWRAIAAARRVAISKEILFNYRISNQSVQSNCEYALSVFKNISRIVTFVEQSPQRTLLQPYFQLFLRLLVLHMLVRSRLTLDANDDYRRQFHSKMKGLFESVGPVPLSLLDRWAYIGPDCERMDLVATLPFDEWWPEVRGLIFGSDGGRWSSPLAFYVQAQMALKQACDVAAETGESHSMAAMHQARQTLSRLYQAMQHGYLLAHTANDRCRMAETDRELLLSSNSWRAMAPLRTMRGLINRAKDMYLPIFQKNGNGSNGSH